MGRFNMKAVLLILVMLVISVMGLNAEKLGTDVNGNVIQSARYFTAVRDSIPAQAAAAYDSLAVPSNANEMTVIFRHQAGYIYAGAAKTLAADATDWIYIPKDIAVTFPTQYSLTYLKYKSATGAASINIIWKRM